MDALKIKQRDFDGGRSRHFIVTDKAGRQFRFSIDEDFRVLIHLTTSIVRDVTIANLNDRVPVKNLHED